MLCFLISIVFLSFFLFLFPHQIIFSFPPIFLIFFTCYSNLSDLLIHVWWVVSLYLLWVMLLWAYAWDPCSMWVKWNHRPVLHVVKTWGFVFSLGGFIPIPPQIRIPCRDEILEGLPSRCLACSPCSDGTVFWGSWCLQGSSPPTPLLPVAPRRCLLSLLSSVPLFVLCPFPTLFSLHL